MATISEDFRAKYLAWRATASDDERRAVDAMLQEAHDQASAVASSPAEPTTDLEHRQLAFALSSISDAPPPLVDRTQPLPATSDDIQRVAAPAPATRGAVLRAGSPLIQRAITTKDGSIFGHGKFEQLDPGWLRAAGDWLEYKDRIADVLRGPPVELAIPDTVSLGVLGDWGTGYWEQSSPAQAAANALLARKPEITLHLGDEYYSGQAEQESVFARLWPAGSLHSFALNSNHAMYSGANGYLQQTLGYPAFAAQNKTSYFCLNNSSWLLLGLDSAYAAPWNRMYLHGQLEAKQKQFIRAMASKHAGKRVVVFTHHEPFGLDDLKPNQLWTDVTLALENNAPLFWYFGHAHAAVAYNPLQGCSARCAGHGAIPYADPFELRQPTRDGKVAWYEHTNAADPRVPERCLNGGVVLEFDKSSLRETFFDENGHDRFSHTTT